MNGVFRFGQLLSRVFDALHSRRHFFHFRYLFLSFLFRRLRFPFASSTRKTLSDVETLLLLSICLVIYIWRLLAFTNDNEKKTLVGYTLSFLSSHPLSLFHYFTISPFHQDSSFLENNRAGRA